MTYDLVAPFNLMACAPLGSDHLPILIDTRCHSSFSSLPGRPDLRRTERTKFQVCMEDRLPSNPELPNEVGFDSYVEKLSRVILEALAVSTPKSRLRGDPRPLILLCIQDEIV